MTGPGDGPKFDHVVSVMFENRSFDNLLGRLYQPGEVPSFEGAAGRELSNPVPDWAGPGPGRVPYQVAANLDTPNPDPGEEYPHVNTQLFGIIDPPGNRGVLCEHMTAPYNAPADPDAPATMDGFVADYISAFTAEQGRPPTQDEYAQIMTGYTPDQVPVISAIARGFATFDHWHCEVPTQTFANRSFYHAASSSGFVTNTPYDKFPLHNHAPTIFERLDAANLPWRVYVDPGMRLSITGLIHAPQLWKHFATRFSGLDDFFDDAEHGRLPAYSFIEPCLIRDHNDYHPPVSSWLMDDDSPNPPSPILGGEDLLARIYSAVRAADTAGGSNFANTLFLVAFDEHGGNYDHVPPPRADPPDQSGPGEMGFRFDRAGVRIPTLAVSAYIDPKTVVTGAYRNTSLIATLRARWDLGSPLNARDAAAPDIAPVLTRAAARPQEDWPEVTPRPLPPQAAPPVPPDRPLPRLGQHLLGAAIALDALHNGHVAGIDPKTATSEEALEYLSDRAASLYPGLAPHPS